MVWRVGLFTVVTAACGPQVPVDGEGEDGSTSVTPGSDSSEASITSIGEESTATPIACEEFDNAGVEGRPVIVEIVNVGAQPLLLDAPCFNYDYLELTTQSGWRWPGGFCETTCEAQFIEGCSVCVGCAASAYTVVMPGASRQVEWPGHLFAYVTPPEECFEQSACGETCPQVRVDLAEVIDVSVRAVAFDDCVANERDPNVCLCADDVATCETGGSTSIEPSLQGAAIYEPGALGPIVIEIEG